MTIKPKEKWLIDVKAYATPQGWRHPITHELLKSQKLKIETVVSDEKSNLNEDDVNNKLEKSQVNNKVKKITKNIKTTLDDNDKNLDITDEKIENDSSQ